MKRILRAVCGCVLALAVTGCATPIPQPLDNKTDIPASFAASQAASGPLWPQSNWWTGFQVAELTSLMERAQAQNLDVAQAKARVVQAEALMAEAQSGLFPQLSGRLSAERRRSGGLTGNTFGASLNGSYILDYMGENQNLVRSAEETLRATRFAQAAVGLGVQSAVAQSYFTILALRENIAITRRNASAARALLDIARAKFTTGTISNRDVAQQQVVVSREEGRLPQLVAQERQARHALAVLLGIAPQGFDIQGVGLIDVAAPAIRAGLPSELLLRRPDIGEAEANLNAAHANLDAARAAFFPRIGLSASIGAGAAAIDALTSPGSFLWSLGASLAQVVFDGGRIAAQNDRARAEQEELIARYRQTVFRAFADVEDGLVAVEGANERLVHAMRESQAAMEGYRVSELQYREGTIDITALLSAQQQLFSAESNMVEARQARLSAHVALYLALGGGWHQDGVDLEKRDTGLTAVLRGLPDENQQRDRELSAILRRLPDTLPPADTSGLRRSQY